MESNHHHHVSDSGVLNRNRLLPILCLCALFSGCHRTSDVKAKRLYEHWEANWRVARRCFLGKEAHTADPTLQLELADLLGETGDCPSWIKSQDENLPLLTNADFAREEIKAKLAEYENATNIWTLLEPDEVSDELAKEIVELTSSVQQVGDCVIQGCETDDFISRFRRLLDARKKLRIDLGYTKDPTTVTAPIDVMTPAIRPRALDGTTSETKSRILPGRSSNFNVVVENNIIRCHLGQSNSRGSLLQVEVNEKTKQVLRIPPTLQLTYLTVLKDRIIGVLVANDNGREQEFDIKWQ